MRAAENPCRFTRTFTADNAGNTTTRTSPTGDVRKLTWNPEGTLDDVTTTSGSFIADHVYDADGQRVLRRTATISVLYVGGDEITVNNSTGVLTAKRHYTINGRTIALRTGTTSSAITSLIADHHGTMERNLNNGTGTLSKNRYRMPFGDTRGPALSWPDSRGYVGGVDDPSGLTHLGAREYDPTTGTFISVDPLIDITDPIQMNGYTYANNNPITLADPDGLRPCADNDCRITSPAWTAPQDTKAPAAPTSTTGKSASSTVVGATSPTRVTPALTTQVFASPHPDTLLSMCGKHCQWNAPGIESPQNHFDQLPGYRQRCPGGDEDCLFGTGLGLVLTSLIPAPRVFALARFLRGPKAVSAAANTARVFTSADAHVASAANAIEAALPGRVAGVNTQRAMANGLTREVDIDLGNLLVQVKSGNARGLTGQIMRTEASTGTRTIGYAPDISDAAWRNAALEGIPILRTPDELLAYVREFG